MYKKIRAWSTLHNSWRGGGRNVTSWLLHRSNLISNALITFYGRNFLAFGSWPKVSGKNAFFFFWRGQRILINRLAKNLISVGVVKWTKSATISVTQYHPKCATQNLSTNQSESEPHWHTFPARFPPPTAAPFFLLSENPHTIYSAMCVWAGAEKAWPKARCVSRSINAIHSLSPKWPATRKLTFCLLAKCLSSTGALWWRRFWLITD